MDRLITLFTNQWQRKLVAVLIAFILWLFIDQSITDTKTIPNVPIRVINIPDDKTILGMLPNGILSKRINLTLSGTKKVIDSLEPGDLQVLIDATNINHDDWIVEITKKNLVSLNPSIDLLKHVTFVQHPDFIVKFSRLATAKIPITVIHPRGSTPQGYEYLDIWPQTLKHTVVGPEEQVQSLANKGLELTIDMGMITKNDLDKIKSSRENFHDDEVSFFIPNHWKKISLPFRGNVPEEINDPEAQNLHIDFLRKEYLPIERDISINVFYPLETLDRINPNTHPLIKNEMVKFKNDSSYIHVPLYVKDVSLLFLEVIRDSLEIVVVAQPGNDGDPLNWSLSVVDPRELEDRYVAYLIANNGTGKTNEPRHTKKRETHLRMRFRDYIQKLTLYRGPDQKFLLDAELAKDGISVVPIQSAK